MLAPSRASGRAAPPQSPIARSAPIPLRSALRPTLTHTVAALRARAAAAGTFVLEPQPWRSYRKRAALTPTIRRHFANIQLRPPQFVPYLLSSAGGFATAETIEVPYGQHAADGFKKRPLVVLTKPV